MFQVPQELVSVRGLEFALRVQEGSLHDLGSEIVELAFGVDAVDEPELTSFHVELHNSLVDLVEAQEG